MQEACLPGSIILVTFNKRRNGVLVTTYRKNRMGSACSTQNGEEHSYKVFVGTPERKKDLRDTVRCEIWYENGCECV